jgi:uncharacterized protein with HEPN domain
MAASSLAPRLTDILDAIAHIRSEMAGVSMETFEADWRKRWLVERGVEIITEASRRLASDIRTARRRSPRLRDEPPKYVRDLLAAAPDDPVTLSRLPEPDRPCKTPPRLKPAARIYDDLFYPSGRACLGMIRIGEALFEGTSFITGFDL